MSRSVTLVAITLLLCSNLSIAQQRPGGGKEGVSRGFESSSPKIGQPLPDVVGFDSDGNQFRLDSLKGHYSVLVFGCLT